MVNTLSHMFEADMAANDIDYNLSITVDGREEEAKAFTAWGDSARLTQIFTNLLSNAVKFTCKAPSKSIHVDVRLISLSSPLALSGTTRATPVDPAYITLHKNTLMQVSVEDSGLGMTPEESKKVFQRFIQGNPST
eukprot:TRINITY_DN8046_c0_g1_i3.p2 TRINITY_DN8046_c0_g1~~TRINITY_DN8046_c0_g1_i3.p2  ORF type:complete len:136 (+),score=13.77 TRINITY_DN8046_c0_g1_i3:197-604(+)